MKKNIKHQISIGMLMTSMFIFTGLYNHTSAQTSKEVRDLSSFQSIALSFSGNVILTQGQTQKVEIEAEQEFLKDVITEVRGEELIIRTEDRMWRNMGQVKIYITMPVISALKVTGSGSITASNNLAVDKLRLDVSGSGSVKIDRLKAQQIENKISGSGSIKISGENASSLSASISGSGKLDAFSLAAGSVTVNISGSGNANVQATETLDTRISGSGSVNYKGHPRVNANATGSGKTVSAN